MSDQRGATSKAGQWEWAGLAVLALPTMLLSLDLSVLFLALPHLSADLGASSQQQLWITDIYVFMTAGFLITMGRLGDRIGRRRLLLIGAPLIAAASVLAAYSVNPQMLIISRGIMGVAGATLLPSTLALIRSMFTDPKQLGVAIAGWTTAYMAGTTLGPVIGGAMLEHFWWGSVFLLGVPVMLVLAVTGPRLLPEACDPAAGRIDLTSVALSLAGILPIIYGLKVVAIQGASLPAMAAAVVGLVFGVLFVRRQRRLVDPLVDLGLLGIVTVRATLIAALAIAAVQAGLTLLVAMNLQLVQGMTAQRAGLWLLLPSVALVTTVNLTPHVARRVRPGYVFAAGLVVAAAGHTVLSQSGESPELAIVMVGIVIIHAGIGPAGALINQLILAAAPTERAGSAASLASTSGEFGIAFGIATLGSLAAAVYARAVVVPTDISAQASAIARESLVGAATVAERLSEPTRGELLASAQNAFGNGLSAVAMVSTIAFAVLAAFTARKLRHEPPTGATENKASELD